MKVDALKKFYFELGVNIGFNYENSHFCLELRWPWDKIEKINNPN